MTEERTATLNKMLKYAELYKSVPALRALRKGAGAYLVSTEDTAAALLVARLIISEGFNVPLSVASASVADIIELPIGKNFTVEDSNMIAETCALMPYDLSKRFYIIENAHTLNAIHQNKLLKVLEEPPEPACFILLSAGEGLLTTVKSRCTLVTVPPFPADVIREEVSKAHPDVYNDAGLALASASCGGLIGVCERNLEGGDYTRAYISAVDILTNLKSSRDEPKAYAAFGDNKDRAAQILDFFELIFADLTRYRAGIKGGSVLSEDVADELASMYSVMCMPAVMKAIKRARLRLKNNNNIISVADELLYALLEEKAKWQSK